MLQEYPTQIQPRSSSTRDNQDALLLQDGISSSKSDAEASRILIDLANQDTSNNLMIIDNKYKQKTTHSVRKASLPIKTDTNFHLQKERIQPDPIMLLVSAAAVIDEGKYKGRSYERREIRLHNRNNTSKRRSLPYYNDDSDSRSSTSLPRRHSDKRYQYKRTSISTQKDHWMSSSALSNKTLDEEYNRNEETTHAFSWQYLSMKQNPRIKRNAMHAYIAYMIYTDIAHEQPPRTENATKFSYYNNNSNTTTETTEIKASTTRYNTEENITSIHPNNSDWYPAASYMQSYRLPPSPRQRHDPPPPPPAPTESIIGRPLTDYLFEHRQATNSLLPPTKMNEINTSRNATYYDYE